MTLSPEALSEDIREIKAQLDEIQRMVRLIAVQDQRIKHCEANLAAIVERHDRQCDTMVAIQKHQASCPRDQLKWVWAVLIPQGLALLGVLMASIAHMLSGNK